MILMVGTWSRKHPRFLFKLELFPGQQDWELRVNVPPFCLSYVVKLFQGALLALQRLLELFSSNIRDKFDCSTSHMIMWTSPVLCPFLFFPLVELYCGVSLQCYIGKHCFIEGLFNVSNVGGDWKLSFTCNGTENWTVLLYFYCDSLHRSL